MRSSHDAEQRQAIDQQAKTIRTFREALDWSGLKVTTNDILSSLQELGPTGTREEAIIQAVAIHAVHMLGIAQRVLEETKL